MSFEYFATIASNVAKVRALRLETESFQCRENIQRNSREIYPFRNIPVSCTGVNTISKYDRTEPNSPILRIFLLEGIQQQCTLLPSFNNTNINSNFAISTAVAAIAPNIATIVYLSSRKSGRKSEIFLENVSVSQKINKYDRAEPNSPVYRICRLPYQESLERCRRKYRDIARSLANI